VRVRVCERVSVGESLFMYLCERIRVLTVSSILDEKKSTIPENVSTDSSSFLSEIQL
jgi:hypothetical protein